MPYFPLLEEEAVGVLVRDNETVRQAGEENLNAVGVETTGDVESQGERMREVRRERRRRRREGLLRGNSAGGSVDVSPVDARPGAGPWRKEDGSAFGNFVSIT
jgi:hypothetical protein